MERTYTYLLLTCLVATPLHATKPASNSTQLKSLFYKKEHTSSFSPTSKRSFSSLNSLPDTHQATPPNKKIKKTLYKKCYVRKKSKRKLYFIRKTNFKGWARKLNLVTSLAKKRKKVKRKPKYPQLSSDQQKKLKKQIKDDTFSWSNVKAVPEAHWLITKQDLDPKQTDNRGHNALHLASVAGSLEVIKYLIEQHHLDPTQTNNKGDNALHCACKGNSLKMVKYFLRKDHKIDAEGIVRKTYKVDPTQTNNKGNTPLHIACRKGYSAIVYYLIKFCNLLQGDNNGNNALHLACGYRYFELVEYLVPLYKRKIEATNHKGKNALDIACKKQNWKIAAFLMEETPMKPKIDYVSDKRLLRAAIANNYPKAVAYCKNGFYIPALRTNETPMKPKIDYVSSRFLIDSIGNDFFKKCTYFRERMSQVTRRFS